MIKAITLFILIILSLAAFQLEASPRPDLGSVALNAKVFPSPVSTTQGHFKVTNLDEGNYDVELYDQGGRKVKSEKSRLEPWNDGLKVDLPTDVNGGVYLLIIRNEFGMHKQKLIIK